MKASYCIEGRIHNHKLDTIIVMGSANIRHNNENEKRFFCFFRAFLSSYFASSMKQKDLLICQERKQRLFCIQFYEIVSVKYDSQQSHLLPKIQSPTTILFLF